MAADALPSNYDHSRFEGAIYASWEQTGAFQIGGDPDKDPFSILMPPPNANASLHAGHAMYVIQDILVRWKRMQGHPTCWFPGTDHAGFETQVVYEKHLKKQGKSRFQFDRQTLYQDIAQFVNDNSGLIQQQLRRLGFSADWSRNTFMLDDRVVGIVLNTFEKLSQDGLIYRDNYIVNYCPKCGTTFADLEITHVDQVAPLYSVRYVFADGEPRIVGGRELRELVVATVRPETIFADVAVAVHPSDPRAMLVGEYVLNPLTRQPIRIIADEGVDPEFGTGCLKVTPAHDAFDFQLGKKFDLPIHSTITTQGKITLVWLQSESTPLQERAALLRAQFEGLGVLAARAAVVKLLQAENAIDHINERYQNSLTVCYKGNHPIEPLPYPNWFVRMQPLAQLGLDALHHDEVKIIPQRFTTQYEQWLSAIRDWPISRQIVWGIRMPVWYDTEQHPDILVSFLDDAGERHTSTVAEARRAGYSLETLARGLQTLTAPMTARYVISRTSPGPTFLQETDVFDTWFSSGQWPLTVLGYPDGELFRRFYPTSVLDTMWDILFFWVARMVMLGKYLTGQVPFRTVYLHSMVTDEKGAKMSKSKGNVINPIDLVDTYGADALRIALIAGSAPGNPIALSEAKVKGYRNFANKLWNIARFIQLQNVKPQPLTALNLTTSDRALIEQLNTLIDTTTKHLEQFRFSDAALGLYDFLWNALANDYLENNKSRGDKATSVTVVQTVFITCLALLHPFMPFITEVLYQQLKNDGSQLITAPWPSRIEC